MTNLSNKSFFIAQSLCIVLIGCSMLLDIPWYLRYYIFPIVPIGFMFLLAVQKINETNEKKLDAYAKLVQSYKNDKEWLEKEFLFISQKSSHILFNKIHKSKLEILKTYIEHLSRVAPQESLQMDSSNINTTLSKFTENNNNASSHRPTIKGYNKELYDRIWVFMDNYITTALTSFFSENEITTIKQSIFEYFINERRKIEVTQKVIIPEYLSMQDMAHFFHNISELMSYYKKLKQSDFFRFLPYFIEMGDYDPQSLYRNSTRSSSTSMIQLCRISKKGNAISDFVDKLKKEMPYNQRIIS